MSQPSNTTVLFAVRGAVFANLLNILITTQTVSPLFPQEGVERRRCSLDGIDVPSDAIADT